MHFHQRCKKICELLKHMLRYMSDDILWEDQDLGMLPHHLTCRERSGSVVECLTRDLGAAGSSLTSVIALWFLSKTHLS